MCSRAILLNFILCVQTVPTSGNGFDSSTEVIFSRSIFPWFQNLRILTNCWKSEKCPSNLSSSAEKETLVEMPQVEQAPAISGGILASGRNRQSQDQNDAPIQREVCFFCKVDSCEFMLFCSNKEHGGYQTYHHKEVLNNQLLGGKKLGVCAQYLEFRSMFLSWCLHLLYFLLCHGTE